MFPQYSVKECFNFSLFLEKFAKSGFLATALTNIPMKFKGQVKTGKFPLFIDGDTPL